MYNSIKFKIKVNVDADKKRLLELFFKDWVDGTCDNQVSIENTPHETYKVDFRHQEDALAILLRGVPKEFQHYLEIIN